MEQLEEVVGFLKMMLWQGIATGRMTQAGNQRDELP
jgi:hypothetical protein